MSTRIEWAVLERPSMCVTLEASQRIVPVKSESDARHAVTTKPSIYVGIASRTVTDWEETK